MTNSAYAPIFTDEHGIKHYGKDKPFLGDEYKFQESAMRHIWDFYDPEAYHVTNESKRNVSKRNSAVKQGLKKGVSDITINFPVNGYHGAFIELKVAKIKPGKRGLLFNYKKVSPDQIRFLNTMQQRGYFVGICWGLDGLMKFCKDYFQNDKVILNR